MATDTWSDAYSVGDPLLDRQHEELLDLCDEAAECLADDSPAGYDRLRDILDRLVVYTETHFREEERQFREYDYPQYQAHRAEHIDYQVKLTGFLLDAGSGQIDREALFHYLSEWWTQHILKTDMYYKGLLKPGG